MLDSPYVRRVAITAQVLGINYLHRPLSVFRNYEDIRAINPSVKVPTLVCDDGEVLTDSTLIIDYLEHLAKGKRSLLPTKAGQRRKVLQITGVALVAMEKTVALLYETRLRPKELQHEPWIVRVEQQLAGAVELMSDHVGDGERWLAGSALTQADVSTAVAIRFVRHIRPEAVAEEDFPGLTRFSERAEALPEFLACPFD